MNSAKDIAGNLTWTHALEHEANQAQLIRERRFSGSRILLSVPGHSSCAVCRLGGYRKES